MSVVSVVAVVCGGLLAGEELIVRWGVAPAMRALPDAAHLRVRIALVHRLRVVVPLLIAPAVLTAVAAVVLDRAGPVAWAALAVLGVFVLSSALGTVPINMRVADWDPDDPPSTWRATVARWEAIDVLRSSTAVVAFVLLAVAVG